MPVCCGQAVNKAFTHGVCFWQFGQKLGHKGAKSDPDAGMLHSYDPLTSPVVLVCPLISYRCAWDYAGIHRKWPVQGHMATAILEKVHFNNCLTNRYIHLFVPFEQKQVKLKVVQNWLGASNVLIMWSLLKICRLFLLHVNRLACPNIIHKPCGQITKHQGLWVGVQDHKRKM